MARKARVKSKSGMYHVLLRAKSRLFLDDSDREYFNAVLEKYLNIGDTGRLLGKRISDGCVHLIIDEGDGSLSAILKPMCTSYARYFNRVHGTDGSLFDGRFKSEPIENDYELASIILYMYRDGPKDYEKDLLSVKNQSISLNSVQRQLFIDEYEKMQPEEFLQVLNYLVGASFDKMSPEEKLRAVLEADKRRVLRIGLIKNALGLDKSTEVRKRKNSAAGQDEEKEENNEKPRQAKKELSFWLL